MKATSGPNWANVYVKSAKAVGRARRREHRDFRGVRKRLLGGGRLIDGPHGARLRLSQRDNWIGHRFTTQVGEAVGRGRGGGGGGSTLTFNVKADALADTVRKIRAAVSEWNDSSYASVLANYEVHAAEAEGKEGCRTGEAQCLRASPRRRPRGIKGPTATRARHPDAFGMQLLPGSGRDGGRCSRWPWSSSSTATEEMRRSAMSAWSKAELESGDRAGSNW